MQLPLQAFWVVEATPEIPANPLQFLHGLSKLHIGQAA